MDLETLGIACKQPMHIVFTSTTLNDGLHFGQTYLSIVFYDNRNVKVEMESDQNIRYPKKEFAVMCPDLDNDNLAANELKLDLQSKLMIVPRITFT